MVNHKCTQCAKDFITPENNPVRIYGIFATIEFEGRESMNCFCSFSCAKKYKNETFFEDTEQTQGSFNRTS